MGNDHCLDILPAKAVGVWAYLVTDGAQITVPPEADMVGDMADFRCVLRERGLPGMAQGLMVRRPIIVRRLWAK